MEKIITYTLDGDGEQDLIESSMVNIPIELTNKALDFFERYPEEEVIEFIIRVERKMTQKQYEELGDYNG